MTSQLYKKYFPSRRTLVLDGQIEAKLRELQGQLITTEGKNFSLSKIVNLLLLGGIFASEKLSSNEWFAIKAFYDGRKIDLDEMPLQEYILNLSTVGRWV